MPRLFVLLTLLGTPVLASAAVELSEIAWMGSIDSANHEWIELHNSGAAQSVDGWSISDGNNLEIDLVGTIPANSYLVLERTSDDSAVGAAFMIYTGALTNTGATLTLRNAAGVVVDQVVGGTNWSNVGGDNETKATAQRTTTGWVTAPATPGRSRTGSVTTTVPTTTTQTDDVVDETTDSQSTPQAQPTTRSPSQGGTDAVPLTLPGVTLQLDISSVPHAHVNQPIEFTVSPSGVGDTIAQSLQYTWNFGDGSTGYGADVSHQFTRPGRYVVVVEGSYKRQRQVDRIEIDILPVSLELEQNTDNSITITNSGDSEIELSDYRLVGYEAFRFPSYSILLPGHSITIDATHLGVDTNEMLVVLYDQADQSVGMVLPEIAGVAPRLAGQLARPTRLGQRTATGMVATQPTPRMSALTDTHGIDQSPSTPTQRFSFASQARAGGLSEPVSPAAATTTPIIQTATVADSGGRLPVNWPLYSLVGILLLGIAAVYFVPMRARGEV